jgi:hypothetical protein
MEPVGNRQLPTSGTHSGIGSWKRLDAVFPGVHTVYYSYEVFLKND